MQSMGNFYSLNKLIAEPQNNQIEKICKKLKINYFDILGAQSLIFKNGEWVKELQKKISFHSKDIAIENSKS